MIIPKHNKSIVRLILMLAVCSTLLAGADPKISGGYDLVINRSNPYRADSNTAKTVIRQLYLKERTRWPNRIDSKPFARPAGSSEQQALLQYVLRMGEGRLAEHWIEAKQRTGETAPRSVGSDRMLLRFVARYPGAFGVVPRGMADSEPGVVVLFTLR